MCNLKEVLEDLINKSPDVLINEWVNFSETDNKEEEYRLYDDFLGFFSEVLKKDLDINSDEAEALYIFFTKIIELKGEKEFFNFRGSIYSSCLKYPILKFLLNKNCVDYDSLLKLSLFFDKITSKLTNEVLNKHLSIQNEAVEELEEREAPMNEIWDKVLMLSIVGTLDSNRVLKIIDKVLHRLDKNDLDYVIIDISAIYDMNSEVARQIMKLNHSIHFMGAKPILTGITPNIAKNLTHIEINFNEIETYSTTKKAMKKIINLL